MLGHFYEELTGSPFAEQTDFSSYILKRKILSLNSVCGDRYGSVSDSLDFIDTQGAGQSFTGSVYSHQRWH
jgi:hypothetical protein